MNVECLEVSLHYLHGVAERCEECNIDIRSNLSSFCFACLSLNGEEQPHVSVTYHYTDRGYLYRHPFNTRGILTPIVY